MAFSRCMILASLTTIATGCATSYGNDLAIDYSQRQIPASIVVSDAKLYRREALINERRREVQYIDRLMAKSEEDGFSISPEIVREIEVIKALALSAGLNFDPAAGETYRDGRELADIQQDINVLQLQLQLDQLRRDAAIFRERLASQIDPSRSDLGKPTSAPPAATPTLTPEDAKDLIARIDDMQETLAGRLEANVAKPRGVEMKGSPIDQFRDRAAYRQMLTTARNAASLDELHDLNGAALYRLSFQVSTLPPLKSHRRSAGIVEMQPLVTEISDEEMKEIYSRWLDHLNQVLSEADADDPVRLEIGWLATEGLISVVQYTYNDGRSASRSAAVCRGFLPFGHPPGDCGVLMFAMPNLPAGSVSLLGEGRSMSSILTLDLSRLFEGTYQNLVAWKNARVSSQLLESGSCTLKTAEDRSTLHRNSSDSILRDADTLVSAAVSVSAAVQLLTQAMRRAASSSVSEKELAAIGAMQTKLHEASGRAKEVLRTLAEDGCKPGERLSLPAQDIVVPKKFEDLVNDSNMVRVYEVGPREQVQQVSTAARAAEAFSLAMALAAKAPSAAAAGKVGLGYSRNATGKVDAVERLPVVVGFAQAKDENTIDSTPRFGWILGPRVNLIDAKRGALRLEQVQKSYDLSADLAVSGWRTRLTLVVRTAWSPDWNSGSFANALNTKSSTQSVIVNLRPSADEFSALTTQLVAGTAGGGQRFAVIRRITPEAVKACTASTLIIEGENLWRATEVIVEGQRIGGNSIAVLPNMGGITVDIATNTGFPKGRVDVQVLTPYGVVRSRLPLLIEGHDANGCNKPEAKVEGPTVARVAPEVVNICSSPSFMLYGQDLDKLTEVRLGQAIGRLADAKPQAKQRSVAFSRDSLQQIATEHEVMEFWAGEKSLPSKPIRIVRNCDQRER